MKTTYRSKIDSWLITAFGIAFVIMVIGCTAALASGSVTALWSIIPTVAFGIGLPLWIVFSTRYTIEADHLTVASGPFTWKILITDIKSIEPTSNPLSSPALSLDRLRITYGQNKSLMISPREKDQFVRDIQALRHAV